MQLTSQLSKKKGPTEIWTQIVRVRVWSANHYTIEPALEGEDMAERILYKCNFCMKYVVLGYAKNLRTTRMGFEPTRAMHNGLAVHHLNRSVTSSCHDYLFSHRPRPDEAYPHRS